MDKSLNLAICHVCKHYKHNWLSNHGFAPEEICYNENRNLKDKSKCFEPRAPLCPYCMKEMIPVLYEHKETDGSVFYELSFVCTCDDFKFAEKYMSERQKEKNGL